MASNDYYNQGGNYNNQNYGPPQGGYPQHPQAVSTHLTPIPHAQTVL